MFHPIGRFIIITIFALTVLVAMGSVPVAADIPPTVSFQGLLRDPSGMIVPNGDYDLTFRLYDVATGGSHGGTLVQFAL
jgi:hypothetical protein